VGQLVNDNSGFKITITEWSSGDPEIHSTSIIWLPGGAMKLALLKPLSVLCIDDHGVVLCTTTAEVALLEIASNLVESISVGSTIRVNDGLDESAD
jgi:hypothetical protein